MNPQNNFDVDFITIAGKGGVAILLRNSESPGDMGRILHGDGPKATAELVRHLIISATRIGKMGYDAQACVEELPELLRRCEIFSELNDVRDIKSLLVGMKAKPPKFFLFDPKIARAAKATLATKLEKIAALYLPEGWSFVPRKSLSGRAFFREKRISAPEPKTRKALYIFLHECAHAHLHSVKRKKRHVEEMEAEKWAHEKMRKHGIAVPRSMTRRAKNYVRYKISQALKRGAKRIDPKARSFAKK